MIEGRMNGVAEAHYGQSMYGSGYPMNPAPHYFFKDAHLYGRQLPQKIEVTSNPPYHPYVTAADHQTPINLVSKDMPPETNGYAAAFSHRNVAASPYPNIFPYHPSSLIPGPYTPHQQVHYTPHRAPYTTTTTSAIPIPISRPAIEPSPVEVKTSQAASVNGENHAFKKPDEGNNRYHQKYRSRKRQVHVPTPAPIPVSTTSVPQFVPPPSNEPSPQPPAQQSQSQLQPPLHPILNDNVELHSIDRFGADHLVQCGSEKTANVTVDEFESMVKRGEFVRMQEITMEDWKRYARKSGTNLSLTTIKRISKIQSGKVQYLLLHNSTELGVLEAEAERPLFVCGQGWRSYSPDRTRERCKGMSCGKINEGDVVLTIKEDTRKRTIEDSATSADQSSIKKQPRLQKQTDLKENHPSDYHDSKKPKRPSEEALAQVPDHMPLKKHWFQKNNDLGENHIGDSYHEFNNNAMVAVNRGASKRPTENDSNNNNENASTAATRKRLQEEANKTRRWSDSCLEKPSC